MVVILRTTKSLRSIAIFPDYNPQLFTKVKIISVYLFNPQERYDNFPHSKGTLTGILKGFTGKEIQFDFTPQTDVPFQSDVPLCHSETKPYRPPNLISKQNTAPQQAENTPDHLRFVRKHLYGQRDCSTKLVHPNRFGYKRGRQHFVINLSIVPRTLPVDAEGALNS